MVLRSNFGFAMTILIIQKDRSQGNITLQLVLELIVLFPLHFQQPLLRPILLLLQPILRLNERSQEPGWGREGTPPFGTLSRHK